MAGNDATFALFEDVLTEVMEIFPSAYIHIDREPSLVDRQPFPRLLAIAERAWSPASEKNWECFEPRLNAHEKSLHHLSVTIFRVPER